MNNDSGNKETEKEIRKNPEQVTAMEKCSRKILAGIPSNVPSEAITLTKLPDGYKLHANHKKTSKDEYGTVESSFMYQTEEHYGVDVKDLRGGFNENGVYEVNISFK